MSTLRAIALFMSVAVALSLATAGGARAEELPIINGGIEISRITARSAKAGALTIITFDIENFGSDSISIQSVKFPTNEPSRLVGLIGPIESVAVPNISVLPGERVSVDGRSLWIEIGPLVSDWQAGTHRSARFVLSKFEMPVEIHVEAPAVADNSGPMPSIHAHHGGG